MANQKVHYAVLELDDKNYALPLHSFNLAGDKDDLVLASTGVISAWTQLDTDNDGRVSRDDFEKGYGMGATQ